MKRKVTPQQVDAILPQTQCGLCSYDGCQPYATAIAQTNESLALCPPGGVAGLKKLGELTGENIEPFIAGMQLKQKPPLLAKIREDECIGCTKCIQACPVDAIFGAAKLMHVVITHECTGCELCVEPCPVDCIDMIEIERPKENKSAQYRQRYQYRNQRLAKQAREKHSKHQSAKQLDTEEQTTEQKRAAKKAAIQAALQRKRSSR